MIRRTIVRLLVLLVLAVLVLLTVADRLTESAASHAVSVSARQAGLLATDPTVKITGFPFLTQAFRRRYTEIDVTTHGIHRSGLRLEAVTGRFDGVHLGLGATLDGDLTDALVDRATGEVEVSYADLDRFLLARHLSVAPVGTDRLRLTGRAMVGKTAVTVTGPVTVTARAGVVTFAPTAAGLLTSGVPLTAKQAAALAATFTIRIRLASLPFGVQVRAATIGPDGLHLAGTAIGPAVQVPTDAAQTAAP